MYAPQPQPMPAAQAHINSMRLNYMTLEQQSMLTPEVQKVLYTNNCQYILRRGERKGTVCGRICRKHTLYCYDHSPEKRAKDLVRYKMIKAYREEHPDEEVKKKDKRKVKELTAATSSMSIGSKKAT